MVRANLRPIVTAIDTHAHTAWYATLVTSAIIIVGAFGSLFSPEIRGAFPFPGTCALRWTVCWSGGIVWPAVFWWGAAIVTALLYFRREAVVFERAEATRAGLEQQSAQLLLNTSEIVQQGASLGEMTTRIETQGVELVGKANSIDERAHHLVELIRTLPPETHLGTFTLAYSRCHQVLVDALSGQDSSDPAYIERAIRFVLQWILVLAQHFDRRDQDYTYVANVMLFRATAQSEPDAALARLHPFREFRFDWDDLEGFLSLHKALSTSARNPMQAVESLSVISLPVLRSYETADRKRIRVLPGAPLAFASEKLIGVNDTNALAEWCRENGDFTESLAGEIERYFQNRPYRSFVSIPIQPYDRSIRPLGVINIQRDEAGDLLEKLPAKHFLPLLDPLMLVLIDLLELLNGANPSLNLFLACRFPPMQDTVGIVDNPGILPQLSHT